MTKNSNSLKFESLLVVDDSFDAINIIKERLGKFTGQIYTANNGRDGAAMAEHILPELILMDWEMPIWNGEQSANCIKKNNSTKYIPIVCLTSKFRSECKIKNFDLVLNKFVPFDFFLAQITNLMKGR